MARLRSSYTSPLLLLLLIQIRIVASIYYLSYQNNFNTMRDPGNNNNLMQINSQQQQMDQTQTQSQQSKQTDPTQISANMNDGQNIFIPNTGQVGGPSNQQQGPPSQHSSRSPIDRDSPIFRFHGYPMNSTSVKLVWNVLNNYPTEYFNIEWGPLPDAPNAFSIEKLNGSARDYLVHQLQPDTLYQFQLQVHGDNIHRPQLVAIRTPSNQRVQEYSNQNNKDIMPLGVKAEAKSNSSIQLSWVEPDRPASIKNSNRVNIIRYYIVPSLASSPGSSNESSFSGSLPAPKTPQYHYLNITNARESRLIIQRLKPATEYAFAVKTAYYTPDGKRSLSQSGFSMDTSAKTFDLEPSPPKNFTVQLLPQSKEELMAGRPGRLELTWLPPDSPNGQLKGYVILIANEASAPEDRWTKIDVNNGNINNWYVENILHGYNYYFKIRAINQRGASADSEIRPYAVPMANSVSLLDKVNMPIPPNNRFLLTIVCILIIMLILALILSIKACGSCQKPRKGSLNTIGGVNDKKIMANGGAGLSSSNSSASAMPKLNGFVSTNSSSTVAARVGTLARRGQGGAQSKPDFWISAMDQQPEIKSNISEKSNSDINMAMVSIQRNSPQFATTQLAPALPEYRFATNDQQQFIQQQQQSHYHPGHFTGTLGYDQMDNATASALMTLSKRQQQQLQKYQIQFANTGSMAQTLTNISSSQAGNMPPQIPSPHQQPPPPPPLNIDQQQSLYGTHQAVASTRSLRLHRPTLYDPVSGSFLQGAATSAGGTDLSGGPPNYNSHNYNQMHTLTSMSNMNNNSSTLAPQFNSNSTMNSNTLQFYPNQTSTLLSRRSTNTLRSFQNANSTYGQLPGANTNFTPATSIGGNVSQNGSGTNNQQPQQMLQSHQAVINQLNSTNPTNNYPSLPLKHVSTVRPQIMSSLDDQIELELAEKEQQQQQPQQQTAN